MFVEFFIRIGTNPDVITNVVRSLELRQEKKKQKRNRKTKVEADKAKTDGKPDEATEAKP